MSILKKLRVPALLGVGIMAASLVPSGASSHREAPLISQDPVADNTDVYAFRSPDRPDTVTLVANWIPFEEPAGGPNFFNFGDDVLYQIHVDNNADAEPDITYEWRFTTEIQNPNTFLYNTGPITDINDADFNFRQFYDVSVVRDGVRTTHRQPPARAAEQHRPAVHAELRGRRRPGRPHARQRQDLRRPARRPVLRRPGLGLRPARPPAVQHRPTSSRCPPRPASTGWAGTTSTPSPSRCRSAS